MRIAEYKNGKLEYRDATPEEIAEIERQQSEIPEPEPTLDERLVSVEKRASDLETNSEEIQEALDLLLSGVTE